MATARALIIGNSDGIGLGVTRRLLSMGHEVTGVSRSPSPIAHPRYQHHVADVRTPAFAALLATIVAQHPPDLCVYCVGIGDLFDLAQLGHDGAVFEANLLGAVTTAAAVLPAMASAGRGHFVGLSSQADCLPSAEAPSYAASKAGLSHYLEGLAIALRPKGVAVTNVRFGFVATKMAKARVQPFVISVERAVDVLVRGLERRPVRVTYPLRMAALLGLLRMARFLRGVWSAITG